MMDSTRFEDHATETPFAEPATLGDEIAADGWDRNTRPTAEKVPKRGYRLDNR